MWIPTFILEWLKRRQEEKRRNELYARLDRNGAGKFSMKEHRKQLEASKKKQRERARNLKEDLDE